MKIKLLAVTALFLALAGAGCGNNDDNNGAAPQNPGGPVNPNSPTATQVTMAFDFNSGEHGWTAGFADYPRSTTGFEFESGIRPVPLTVDRQVFGYYLKSKNLSGDLFMYLKRELGPSEGIRPNTYYTVTYDLIFASNAAKGCFGAGGAPGESVYLKAGASSINPTPVQKSGDYVRLNINIGNQVTGGSNASVTGNIANGLNCDTANGRFMSVTRHHAHSYQIKSDDNGRLWLIVGTDSGFEGVTEIYFQRIQVTLNPKL